MPKRAKKAKKRSYSSGSVDLIGARWRARLPRDASGKRPVRTFATAEEAMRWLQQRIATPERFDPSNPLGMYLNYWYQRVSPVMAPQTAKKIRSHLAVWRAISLMSLDRVAEDDIQGVVSPFSKTHVPLYVVHATQTLRRALAAAVRWRILDQSPISENLLLPTVERDAPSAWTEEEAAHILRALEGHPWEGPFLLGLYAGVRMGELLALTWDNLSSGVLTISRSEQTGIAGRPIGPTKGRRERKVPLPSGVVAALLLRKAMLPEGTIYMMDRGDGRRPCERTVQKRWREVVEAAGVRPGRGWHQSRHTWATLLLYSGTALPDVAELLGHASPAITAQTYLSSTDERREQAVERLDQLYREWKAKIGYGIGSNQPDTPPGQTAAS